MSLMLLTQVSDIDGKTVRQVIETTIDELTKRLNRPQLPLVSYINSNDDEIVL